MLSVYVIYSKEVCLRLDHCVRLVKLRNIEQITNIPAVGDFSQLLDIAQFYQSYTMVQAKTHFFGIYNVNTEHRPSSGLTQMQPLSVMFKVDLENDQIPLPS